MFNFFRRKKSAETAPIDESSVIEVIDNAPTEADATLALNEAAIAPITEPLVEESLSEAATDAPTATPTTTPANAAANDGSAPEIKTSLADIFNRALDDQLAQIPADEPNAEHRADGADNAYAREETFIAPQPETQDKPSAEQFSQRGWLARLRAGLSKTGTNLRHVFVGVRVDEALFESLEDALLMADQHSRNDAAGQNDMFGLATVEKTSARPSPIATMPDWSEEERLRGEKETLGIYLSGHPITRLADELAALRVTRLGDLTGNARDMAGLEELKALLGGE